MVSTAHRPARQRGTGYRESQLGPAACQAPSGLEWRDAFRVPLPGRQSTSPHRGSHL